MRAVVISALLLFVYQVQADAYPEFQRYSKEVSGRPIDCAICHKNSDGPEGLKHGQIGSLNSEELKALGAARRAFKPGANVKNPILNEFGNSILNQLGKEKILMLRQHPELLSAALDPTSDLDNDGITDAEEFEDGTHPLNPLDGKPLKLFKNNLKKNRFDIFMLILATGFGVYGLSNALLWLSSKMEKKE